MDPPIFGKVTAVYPVSGSWTERGLMVRDG
jgi:hypothetical protein